MKHSLSSMKYVFPLIALFCSLFFTNCQKAPINKNLDGRWQLMSYVTSDGKEYTCERIYYSIQLHMIEISEKGGTHGYGSFIGRFNYNQDTEKVEVREFRVRGDENKLATEKQLLPFGMNKTETVFDVVKADGKTLVLKSDYATLTFRTF